MAALVAELFIRGIKELYVEGIAKVLAAGAH
jgi:hypothetical protein